MSVDELIHRASALASSDRVASDEELAEIFSPDIVLDYSERIFNPQIYRGFDGLRAFEADMHEIWETVSFAVREIVQEGNRYLVLADVHSRARGSGIEFDATAAAIWTAEDGRLKHFRLLASEKADRDAGLAALRDSP